MARKVGAMRLIFFALLATLLFSVAITIVAQQGAPANGEWRRIGGDGGSTRYSPLDQINAQNVKNLKVVWTWKGDNFGSGLEIKNENTPLMVDGVLYFTAGDRRAATAERFGQITAYLWSAGTSFMAATIGLAVMLGSHFDRSAMGAANRAGLGLMLLSTWLEQRVAKVGESFTGKYLKSLL